MTLAESYIGAETSWVEWQTPLASRAFLAVPKRQTAPFPAVILGHERYGLFQHTLDLAAKFASYGFVCIAPDMTAHWDGDKEALLEGRVNLTISNDQIVGYYSRCLDHLLAMPDVDHARIVAMGVCMSGHYPLLLNGARSEIAANVVFYGAQRDRAPEEVVAKLTAPMLGVFGERDSNITVEDVRNLRDRLERHNKSYEIKVYADSPHGWLNNTMPGRYRQPEAEAAWAYLMDFLQRLFAGAFPKDRVRWRFESDIASDYDPSKNVRLA
jgi:carboxymethylenebutenolidase